MAKNKRYGLLLALGVLASMLLSACGGEATATPPAAATNTAAAGAAPTNTTAAGGAETPTTAAGGAGTATTGASGDLKGKKVSIFGVAADEQARLFQSEFDDFTARTGIQVTYEGNKDFE